MGLVYLAQQREPVKRRVALKIIKPGMDSKQVIARFEAERQALALLDHPNIAHVFDAGTTETGRPYFVAIVSSANIECVASCNFMKSAACCMRMNNPFKFLTSGFHNLPYYCFAESVLIS